MKQMVEIDVKIDPEELASVFCDQDCEYQAKFFNAIHDLSEEWESSLCMQLQSINTEESLKPEGRAVMKLIGDYADEQN